MRIAIISDIHGNLEALKATLKFLSNEKITRIFCLGDIVGYGPFPNECIELIRKHCEVCLLGNHDAAVIGTTDIYYFNQYAKEAILWTQRIVTEYNKDYLKSLPFQHRVDNALLVHSTPVQPEEWNYIQSEFEARLYLDKIEDSIVFIGHSHIPVVFSYSEGGFYKETVLLDDEDRYIINVGSVGQPRDGDSRACFVVFDTENRQLQYIRLNYDIQKTYQAIIENNLPPFLAMRLLSGH